MEKIIESGREIVLYSIDELSPEAQAVAYREWEEDEKDAATPFTPYHAAYFSIFVDECRNEGYSFSADGRSCYC